MSQPININSTVSDLLSLEQWAKQQDDSLKVKAHQLVITGVGQLLDCGSKYQPVIARSAQNTLTLTSVILLKAALVNYHMCVWSRDKELLKLTLADFADPSLLSTLNGVEPEAAKVAQAAINATIASSKSLESISMALTLIHMTGVLTNHQTRDGFFELLDAYDVSIHFLPF